MWMRVPPASIVMRTSAGSLFGAVPDHRGGEQLCSASPTCHVVSVSAISLNALKGGGTGGCSDTSSSAAPSRCRSTFRTNATCSSITSRSVVSGWGHALLAAGRTQLAFAVIRLGGAPGRVESSAIALIRPVRRGIRLVRATRISRGVQLHSRAPLARTSRMIRSGLASKPAHVTALLMNPRTRCPPLGLAPPRTSLPSSGSAMSACGSSRPAPCHLPDGDSCPSPSGRP